MGDWNTLHLFDSDRFFEVVVPDLIDEGCLLTHYFKLRKEKDILWRNKNSAHRIAQIVKFCKEFDKSFKIHKLLNLLESRTKKISEPYNEFLQKRNADINNFIKKNIEVIDDFNKILPFLLFSECAQFNPHLILGRRIFSNSIQAKEGSIAEDCCLIISHHESGSILGYHGEGIFNWLTKEDVQLLSLDIDNITPASEDREYYYSDFIKFINLAIEHDLGFVSVTNIREDIMCRIEKPKLKIPIDLKQLNVNNLIEFHKN